jgi:hypothetical protein
MTIEPAFSVSLKTEMHQAYHSGLSKELPEDALRSSNAALGWWIVTGDTA